MWMEMELGEWHKATDEVKWGRNEGCPGPDQGTEAFFCSGVFHESEVRGDRIMIWGKAMQTGEAGRKQSHTSQMKPGGPG